MLQAAAPAEMGLDPPRWQGVLDLVTGWCQRREIPGAGLQVIRGDRTTGPILFGHQTANVNSPPIRQDAIFLIASITKPMVGAAVLLAAERGLLTLDERVEEYLQQR